MNKEIEKLAELAGFNLHNDFIDGHDFHHEIEKFAKLIVQECSDICYDHSNAAGGVDTAFGYGYKDCGDDIKRNFGVEL